MVGKMHPKDWARLDKIGRVRAMDKRKHRKEYEELMLMTEYVEEHPEDYDGPCFCALCRSYAD
jgi:hypothetical protein